MPAVNRVSMKITVAAEFSARPQPQSIQNDEINSQNDPEAIDNQPQYR